MAREVARLNLATDTCFGCGRSGCRPQHFSGLGVCPFSGSTGEFHPGILARARDAFFTFEILDVCKLQSGICPPDSALPRSSGSQLSASVRCLSCTPYRFYEQCCPGKYCRNARRHGGEFSGAGAEENVLDCVRGLLYFSEIEFQCELNEPRVIARRGDAPEIARIIVPNDPPGAWIDARGGHGVEVADRIGEVNMIEEVEELGAELQVF